MPSTHPKYQVYVDDNFHFMDENERYSAGFFDDCQTAIEKCKEIVDTFLIADYRKGMAADELFDRYKSFGEDPWVSSPGEKCEFSAWSYAEQRCKELCGE